MAEFENPVAGTIFWRFAGPLVPVWLAGVVFMLLLDWFHVGSSSLADPRLALLLGSYSILVAALASVLYYLEYRHSPGRLILTAEGIEGRFAATGESARPSVEYGAIVRISRSGLFPARVEARSIGCTSMDWINVTDDNALRVAEAWGAWRERQPSP